MSTPMESCRITFIKEILDEGEKWHGQSLRVLGRVVDVNAESGLAQVEHDRARLNVDTTKLVGVYLTPGRLFHFFGALMWRPVVKHEHGGGRGPAGEPVLDARLARNVDGLDIALYEESVKVLRKALSSRSTSYT
mmetsp:Transcript_7051/g.25968  ORF Transcript_7051/g.25968 Transcript_7051/m.25968 type:complete len:135 (+) Transcript_7051:125-529(+)